MGDNDEPDGDALYTLSPVNRTVCSFGACFINGPQLAIVTGANDGFSPDELHEKRARLPRGSLYLPSSLFIALGLQYPSCRAELPCTEPRQLTAFREELEPLFDWP